MIRRRRRFKQTISLEQRLAGEAQELREQARFMPAGDARESLLRKARQHEVTLHMSEWLTSPGLRPPE